MRRSGLCGLLGFVLLLTAMPARVAVAAAQVTPPGDLAEAQRLRDAGDFAAAARLLRNEVARRPEDVELARLLAQTLYWAGQRDDASETYEAALKRHPTHGPLRLDYARFLAETGERQRARALLIPQQRDAGINADAHALLGTLAYWDGDLTAARRHFELALASNPAHAEARRQLNEILSMMAPWVRLSSGRRSDDQPIDQYGIGVEGGWFVTPLLPVTVRVEPSRYTVANGLPRQFVDVEVKMAHFAPNPRIDSEFAFGTFRRGQGIDAEWKGHAALSVRLPRHVALGGRVQRMPYLSTTASLETPVAVDMVTGFVRLRHPRGWLGEAAIQRHRFRDENVITAAYAWQLAPLVHRPSAELQAGYSVARENARESRFALAFMNQPFPPGDPRFSTAGRYQPYYTPSEVVTHSLIAAATGRPNGRVTLRAGGAYAIRAREQAPTLFVSGGQVLQTMTPREFSSWSARGSIAVALTNDATLSIQGERSRTAFYTWSTGAIDLTYRFSSR